MSGAVIRSALQCGRLDGTRVCTRPPKHSGKCSFHVIARSCAGCAWFEAGEATQQLGWCRLDPTPLKKQRSDWCSRFVPRDV